MSTGYKLRKIYTAGYCVGRGHIADRSLSWKKVRFDARAFLLEHPKRGLILVDTGYGRALNKITRKGVYSLYRKLLPFTFQDADCIALQLKADGIAVHDLSYLLITHFHPDHIGALPEFTSVPWIYREDALEALLTLSPFRGLTKGFVRPLVPAIPAGSMPLRESHFSDTWNTFRSHAPFQDGSLLLIDLPGHAQGQIGVALKDTLLVADATWGGASRPSNISRLIQEDWSAYCRTQDAIEALKETHTIHPTHTIEAYV